MNDKNTGDPFENAIKIENVPAGYEYLSKKYGVQGKDWKLKKQRLKKEGDKYYDILYIQLISGKKKEIYFNISSFYPNSYKKDRGE